MKCILNLLLYHLYFSYDQIMSSFTEVFMITNIYFIFQKFYFIDTNADEKFGGSPFKLPTPQYFAHGFVFLGINR